MKRVPRESKGIAGLLIVLIIWVLACNTAGVAWDCSMDELVEINNWLIETEQYLCENDGCNTAKWLWDMFDLVVNAQSPDAQGRALNGMMNLLWEHPDLQNDFHNLIVEVKGKAWVTAWMGTAYVVNLAGRWVTVWGMVGLAPYCTTWCDSIPAELWGEIPPPPNCYCGAKEMM